MSEANTSLRISELDFDEIKTNFKQYLGNQSTFQDYNFEGAGMNILLDTLSYTTHYIGMYGNLLGNEMFGDSAQIRSSIVSHAKHIGYIPRSRRTSKALVDVVVTPNAISEDTTANTITLAKNTRLISTAYDGTNYQFVTIHGNNAVKVDGTFTFSNVWIQQGELVTQQYLMTTDNTKAKFTLPSKKIDTSTLVVATQESPSNTTITPYTQATDLTTVQSDSKVFWVEEQATSENQYTIYFGDNYIGKKPANNSIIIASYLECEGALPNQLDTFRFTDPVAGAYSSNVSVSTVQRSAAGGYRETIEEVRKRAPNYYTTQNRAVTVSDYELIIERDYPNVDSVSVWSGADNIPPVYGKIFMSLSPKAGYYISDTEKLRIIDEVIRNRSVVTVIPEIVDPEYVFILARVDVNYDPSKTTLSETSLKNLVRTTILNYRNTDLATFKSTFRVSKLQRLIDESDPSILSNGLETFLQYRKVLRVDETYSYTLDFRSPLRRTSFPYAAYSTPAIFINDSNDVSRETFFEIVPDSFTGIDGIDVQTPGDGYETTPTVTITGDGTGATATAKIVNGKVVSVTLVERGINYSRATVSITSGGGSGATARPILGLSTGVIRSFYYNTLGEKVIISSNTGDIDFSTGKVRITDILPTSVSTSVGFSENTVSFNVPPDEENQYPLRNRIIDIDGNDPSSIIINMIPESS